MYVPQLSVAFGQSLFALQPSQASTHVLIVDATASLHLTQADDWPPLHLFPQLSLCALTWAAQVVTEFMQVCGTAQGITGVEFVDDGRSS